MSSEPPETSELQAFVAIVDEGSVAGAARRLNLPRATVSRRFSRLEDRLGARLAHRTTRAFTLTDAGDDLYHRARAILAAVDDAAAAISRDAEAVRGLLRLSVPPSSSPAFLGMLTSFAEAYPDVELEVIASSRHEDLVARGIDVAFRAGVHLDEQLVARTLATTEVFAVASPAYLERAGVPETAEALTVHDCIVGFGGGERPLSVWPLRDGGSAPVRRRLVSSALPLQLHAALGGVGIALLPELFSRDALAAGQLVPVLRDEVGALSKLSIVYVDRRLMKPAARALIDHVVAWFEASEAISLAAR